MARTQILRAQVVMPYVTNLPGDVVTNTFHFTADPAATIGSNGPAITTRLNSFYNSGTAPIRGYLSDRIDRTASVCRMNIYDNANPHPSPPVWSTTWTLAAATNNDNLPEEVALCLSFKGSPVPGVNPARCRGRVFIGPLLHSTVTASTGLPTSAVLASLVAAGTALKAANTADVVWATYSRAGAFATELTAGWVDNAWDTQRRRGLAATARTTF